MQHSAPVSRPARFVRGWAAAGTSILCAATSHYAVDPAPPNVLLLALAFALAGMVCVLLAGRRMGALRTGCAVLASQVPFHVLFSAGGHCSAAAASPRDAAALAHAHHDPSAVHAALTDAILSSTTQAGHGTSMSHAVAAGHGTTFFDSVAAGHGAMIWAHLLAAAVTFVLLRHVEDGWWRFLAAAARFLFTAVALLRPVLVPCHELRPVPLAYLLPPLAWSPVRVISRRGPPLLSI